MARRGDSAMTRERLHIAFWSLIVLAFVLVLLFIQEVVR